MINGPVIFLLLLLFLDNSKCHEIEKTLEKLDQMIGNVKSFRRSREFTDTSLIWQEYEFESGAGNREELYVTDISIEEYTNLPKTDIDWQFLEVNGVSYLACAKKSTLSLYKLSFNNILIDNSVDLKVDGSILKFKIIGVKNILKPKNDNFEDEIVAVLYVESNNDMSLQWYRLVEDTFLFFWSWPVQKHMDDMDFIQHGTENKLLLLNNNKVNYETQYSLIDVYGFSINFSNIDFNRMWLYQRTSVPKTRAIQVCPIYESISLVLHGVKGVSLYEYSDTIIQGGLFHELQTIKLQNLNNFICFESGHIQYLAASGEQPSLFNFFENEFEFNNEFQQNFEDTEINWIKDVRLDTYREESLLLVQLKNSTVIALAWHGTGFKKISLPNKNLDQYDISKITVIPRFGFVYGNQFVKLKTELKDVRRPSHDETEGMLEAQILLDEVFRKQENIIDETNARIAKSYLKNPIVTGFWNIENVNVTSATLKEDVFYNSVTIGSTSLTAKDWKYGLSTYEKTFNSFKEKLTAINLNLKKALDQTLKDIDLSGDLDIIGNINITGTLNVKHFTANYINKIPIRDMLNNLTISDTEIMLDNTILDSIKSKDLQILSLNGIPVEDMYLNNEKRDYSNVDFSKIKHLIIDGDLTLPVLNNIVWEELMQNVVWKDKPANIPGNTIIEGTLTADKAKVETVNGIPYPDGYVLENRNIIVNVTGSKTFDKLKVTNLLGIKSINGINMDDFMVPGKDYVLNEEITFDDLIVEGTVQIDGEVVGLNAERVSFLNEATNISSNITFTNLIVLGDIILKNSIGGTDVTSFDDLLLKTDKNVEITGTKTFLSDVKISNITITSNTINGHPVDEFVTLDTEQEFPNLEKISSDVDFVKVNQGAVKKLEDFLKESYKNSNSECLQKTIIFKRPVTVNKLSFDTLRHNISRKEFTKKVAETFSRVYFENVKATDLFAEEIAPGTLNDISFTDLIERLSVQHTINNYNVDNLKIDTLDVKSINDEALVELNDLKNRVASLNQRIHNGTILLESLLVTGTIEVPSINEVILKDAYKEKQKGTVTFEKDVSIENLRILGFINGFNFSEYVDDAVLKTDRDIVINAHKTFNSINCQYLEVSHVNGNPIENILDSTKEQTLTGSVVINGSVNVSRNFETNGKIGDVLYRNFMSRFKSFNKNLNHFEGDVYFTSDVIIKNLSITGTLQKMHFKDFKKVVIFKDANNITITGDKIFQSSVSFNGPLTIQEKLNDLDLKKFYENAVYIDKTFSIKSNIIFKDDISVGKDIIILKNLETNTIMGINITELQMNVIYLNRPTYITDMITFSHVTFRSNINAEKINNVDMQLLIPLKTEQTLSVEVLKCNNVTVENIQVLGKINGHDLDIIYKNTFMLIGDQNVTGVIKFHGNVHARQDFNAHVLNDINPKQIVLLDMKDTLIGDFVFKNLIVINGSLRILGNLNGIDLTRWQAVAVTKSFPLKQIITGKWTVHGNVYFEGGAITNGILNGVNITEISELLSHKDLQMDAVITEANMNLENMCEDLNRLKSYAETQIYKFNTFDYLQTLDFDQKIVSVHYFELDDLDYLMISYDTCYMNAFVFTGEKFVLVANVRDFGVIEKWATFRSDKLLYFVTVGKDTCGRSRGNLWKLENDEFRHVLSLGNLTDTRHINDDKFLTLINNRLDRRSVELNKELQRSISVEVNNVDSKYLLNENRLLLASRQSIYEYNTKNTNKTKPYNYFGYSESLDFEAGLTKKELFLYYDEDISENYIFICNNEMDYKKVLQTIEAHKPRSFLILNFEGSVETLLIFVENERNIKIYEYRGVEGFVYKDNIRMNVNKLFNFKLRKFPNLVKRDCLALINENQLTILEAKMYGEKLDLEALPCVKHSRFSTKSTN